MGWVALQRRRARVMRLAQRLRLQSAHIREMELKKFQVLHQMTDLEEVDTTTNDGSDRRESIGEYRA